MRISSLLGLLVALSFFSTPAFAYFGEINGFYFADTIPSSQSSYSREFADAALGFDIDQSGFFQIGWGYDMFDANDNVGGTTTTYMGSATGPKFNFYLGQHKHWSLGALYGFLSSAKYQSGSASAQNWHGTTLKADFGYLIHLSRSGKSNIGVRINYVEFYASKLVSSSPSYFIYPSLYVGCAF